jgi:uncharacterized protein YjiS (DUF1127 family)
MHASSTALRPRTVWPRLSARGLLDRLAAADARHRLRAQMATFDDHMLRDIGVTRADLDRELRRSPW